MRNKTLIAIAAFSCAIAVSNLRGANINPVLPGDLKGKCTLLEGSVLMDDYESTHLTLADRDGKKLDFFYGGGNGEEIQFGNRETARVQSKPGGIQEATLLKILRETMAAQFTPAPTDSDKRLWNYLALKHAIFALDYRCRHKSATIPWDKVRHHWTFGGDK